jgi:hypothetical protein
MNYRFKETIMLGLIIAIILLIVVLAGIFSSYANAAYGRPGGFVAAIAALILFLMAIRVLPF